MKEPGADTDPKHRVVKSFVKDEPYPEYKYPRLINARVDEAKVLLGPFFKCVENVVFKYPDFIKKIPVDQRAKYILDHVSQSDCFYFETDYSQFEAHFKKETMKAVEFVLYDHMLQRHPDHDQIMTLLERMLLGKNHIKGKRFTAEVEATRMSGEMNTSLGNGFFNMMLMKYFESIGLLKNLKGVYEGDDGLSSSTIEPPKPEYFKTLGLSVKLIRHESISTAKFCGLTFDETTLTNITDPISVFLKFGWTKDRYNYCSHKTRISLMRSKAMSLRAEFNSCPIISSFAHNVYRLTKGSRYTTKHMNVYEREKFKNSTSKFDFNTLPNVSHSTRLLFERLYGFSVAEQIRIEKRFDKWCKLDPWTDPAILEKCHPDTLDYYDFYCIPKSCGGILISRDPIKSLVKR
jgi:hypothetical protein